MKKLILTILLLSGLSSISHATPLMQVGVPDGSGGYIQNTISSSNPTEDDTAITSGNTIAVAAQYKRGDISIGGKYLSGPDWEQQDRSIFNGHGAILLASVPDGAGSSAFTSLTVGGNSAFAWDANNHYFGDNHAPLGAAVSDFLFFDLGTFSNDGPTVPNFQDSDGLKDGEVKELTLLGMGAIEWIHFDAMALWSSYGADNVIVNYSDNPGSHDATWIYEDGGGGTSGGTPVPEPSTLILLGAGLVGLAVYRRKKH